MPSFQVATTTITRDLTLSGLFKVLNSKGFLANLKSEGTSIVPKNWLNVGAQAVVKARAVRLGRRIQVEWLLYEPGSKGNNAVLHKAYKGRSARRLAHKFASDIVYYYTKRAARALLECIPGRHFHPVDGQAFASLFEMGRKPCYGSGLIKTSLTPTVNY